jgi:hypothetical protein
MVVRVVANSNSIILRLDKLELEKIIEFSSFEEGVIHISRDQIFPFSEFSNRPQSSEKNDKSVNKIDKVSNFLTKFFFINWANSCK